MDFNHFGTAARSNEAQPLHIKCAATGKPIFDNTDDPFADNGKPCRVLILGAESSDVREAVRQIERARVKASGDREEADPTTIEDVHAQAAEAAKVRIVGFENIDRGEAPATKDDADWFLNLNKFQPGSDHPSFVEQVNIFSAKRENWLGNGSQS